MTTTETRTVMFTVAEEVLDPDKKTDPTASAEHVRVHMHDLTDEMLTLECQQPLLDDVLADAQTQTPLAVLLVRELKRKISGYRAQDLKKQKHDQTSLITLEELVQKLKACAMKCIYCQEHVRILYRSVRDPRQWSLDRLDNTGNHSATNSVIACLKCNLQRRVRDDEKFLFTKQLKIVKQG